MLTKLDDLVADHLRAWVEMSRGPNTVIHTSVSFRNARNITVGDNVRIQPYCVLWASPHSHITIGDHSGLGPGTAVFSSNHQYAPGIPYHMQPWEERDVTIGEGVWIGAGCAILPGVRIGDGAVVAAGSIVTRDVSPGALVGGVPARPLRGGA